ncbi:amidohydrolase family protein, partial [Streptomyces sp. NPDC020125]
EYLFSLGVTGWQDAMIGAFPGNPDNFDVYLRAAREGSLVARVVGALWWDRERGLEQLPELEERRRTGQVGRFNATSVKIMQDGVAENFTAGMLEPYLDGCGCPTANSGLSFVEPALLTEAVCALDRSGFQVHFHALGDRAVREALDALATARTTNGVNDNRHHMAHLQVVHPDDIGRFSSLDVAANIQALWAAHEPQMDELTIPFLGPERAALQYPFGDLRRAGARLVAGSDWSVSSPNPLWGIHVAVNRTVPPGESDTPGAPFYPEQALSLAEAFTAYTAGSAWVNHLDDVTGTIEEGKYADLVVLDRDPFAGPSQEIADARVRRTYIDGRLVFAATD